MDICEMPSSAPVGQVVFVLRFSPTSDERSAIYTGKWNILEKDVNLTQIFT